MKPISVCLLLMLFIFSCKRSDPLRPGIITITEAAAAYRTTHSAFRNQSNFVMVDSLPEGIDWNSAYLMNISGENCLAVDLHTARIRTVHLPDAQFAGGINQSLVFRRSKEGKVYFQLIQAWGNKSAQYGLSMFVFDQTGKFKGGFLSNGETTVPSRVELIEKTTALSRGSGMVCSETEVYSCLYFNGKNYGCTYMYTARQCLILPGDEAGSPYNGYEDNGGESGGFDYGALEKLKTRPFVYAPPSEKIISDLSKYMSCFTSNPNSSYEVTLYVKQPVADTRLLVSDQFGNLFPNSFDRTVQLTVGHTFLGFSQSGGGVGGVSRTIGFYPSTAVSPINPETPGLVVDNSLSGYDVAVSLRVTAAQFKVIIDSFLGQAKSNYNLSLNNCTSIAVDALNAGGQNIPKTIRDWPLGKGADPADLGQDLRLFNSSNLKLKNTNGGKSVPNTAPCK